MLVYIAATRYSFGRRTFYDIVMFVNVATMPAALTHTYATTGIIPKNGIHRQVVPGR